MKIFTYIKIFIYNFRRFHFRNGKKKMVEKKMIEILQFFQIFFIGRKKGRILPFLDATGRFQWKERFTD